GKSTLAKHINALLVPDLGDVYVFDCDTKEPKNTYYIRSNAGLVFQNPDDQLVASIIEQDGAFGPENLGIPSEELPAVGDKALDEVGLLGFGQHETHALSGGQKQRVAIAGILAMDPAILILDEATAMLDPRGRNDLIKLCQKLNMEGMTIVMITHYMEEAALADRVIVLDHGNIRLDGTPQEALIKGRELSELHLDIPFAAQMGYKLNDAGIGIPISGKENDLIRYRNIPRNEARYGRLPQADLSKISEPEPEGVSKENREARMADAFLAFDGIPNADTASNDERFSIEFRNVGFTYSKSNTEKKRKKNRPEKKVKDPDWGSHPETHWSLHDISFCVESGEFLGIAGHTGSGKSTLIQLMNGLLKPEYGQVLINGEDFSDKKVAARYRGRVGLVFQYPENQLFAKSVYDDVAFGPRNLGLSASEVDERVRISLELVNLCFEELAGRSPFELSGGQQRRVAFAGVLAMEPKFLILDEPVAGLDPKTRHEFLDLISGFQKNGLSVVMVSHAMEDLAKMCDRILILNNGSLYALGKPDEVLKDPAALKGIGLGCPAPQNLAFALKNEGWDLPLPFYDEPALISAIANQIKDALPEGSESNLFHEMQAGEAR
ncbi:MAG: energy-coupling factor transporter ATPase, partial [Eggerthellaceae bacterium]|nr:energy-coupling factor transporter ATPase [Eggerthellaceae bacterium]